jgi:hypothetical protein
MNNTLVGISLVSLSLNLAVGMNATARPSQTIRHALITPSTPLVAQAGSQAAKTRILDLGVTEDQLRQMKNLGMKMVMPKNVPAGFRLTDILGHSDQRFGRSYLLVYRKGNICFGVEGTSGGIGGFPAGDVGSYPIKNAVLGRGQLEQWQAGSDAQLLGQWMGRGPFYRFVGANYSFFGNSDLVGCRDISVKDAIMVSEALRYLDLEQDYLEGGAVVDASSPTSTVVKYPSHQELTQFKKALRSGVFGSGSKLSPGERSQRQAYQARWAKVNPTGARFAGAWSTGDRYYYIYPSTVKGRVCVVTYLNNEYEFSNGQSISNELKYRNKGLFWIDQAETLAARDSGNGQLYPVYAVQSVPNPNGLTNFDYGFRVAECTMELP